MVRLSRFYTYHDPGGKSHQCRSLSKSWILQCLVDSLFKIQTSTIEFYVKNLQVAFLFSASSIRTIMALSLKWSDEERDSSPAYHRKLHLRDTGLLVLGRVARWKISYHRCSLVVVAVVSTFTGDLPLVTKICNAMHQLQILASKNSQQID